jgi:hypothetical protein
VVTVPVIAISWCSLLRLEQIAFFVILFERRRTEKVRAMRASLKAFRMIVNDFVRTCCITPWAVSMRKCPAQHVHIFQCPVGSDRGVQIGRQKMRGTVNRSVSRTHFSGRSSVQYDHIMVQINVIATRSLPPIPCKFVPLHCKPEYLISSSAVAKNRWRSPEILEINEN